MNICHLLLKGKFLAVM